MERAPGKEVVTGAFQRKAAADHVDDVQPAQQIVDEILWDAAGHFQRSATSDQIGEIRARSAARSSYFHKESAFGAHGARSDLCPPGT